MYNNGWPVAASTHNSSTSLPAALYTTQGWRRCMLDWLITQLKKIRKEKMQWIPSCCLTLMLLMLQIKMDHAIIYYRSNIVQNDDPHKTELLLSKQSWNGVPLCTRWCGRHWEEIIAESRGLHVWTLDRKKASIQSFVWQSKLSCQKTFLFRYNKNGSFLFLVEGRGTTNEMTIYTLLSLS